MKFFPLVWAGLWRHPARSIFSALCIVAAFLLIGLLEGVNAGFARSIADAHRELLITNTRVRGGAQLPLSSVEKIRAIPGIADVTQRAYFTGTFGENELRNTVAAIATEPAVWFRIRPFFNTDPAQLRAMQTDRLGLLATPPLMRQFGWNIGDTITLHSKILKSDGSGDWVFHVVGTFDAKREPTKGAFGVMNYAYLDEYRVIDRGTAEQFYIRIADPTKAVATAAAIDAVFANSSTETRTRSDQQRAESQAKQLGDVASFTNAIMAAVLFALAFVTGNTMRQSISERRSEFATLKSLGFPDWKVSGFAIAEALLLYLPAAICGLLLSIAVAPVIKESIGAVVVSARVTLFGLTCAAAMALLSVAIPAWQLSRQSIAGAMFRR